MQVVIEIPYIFVQTTLYGVVVYAMIGFDWTADKFFWYIFFMYFTLLYYTFYGMMAVAVTPNHHIAAIVSSSFYLIWMLFSGFIIPKTVSFTFAPCIFLESELITQHSEFSSCNRGFQCDGDGTVTFALLLGLCTGWLLHSLET